MNNTLKQLDVVALLKDIPEKNLVKGQVGTIVEVLVNNIFEIEFCNKKGETIALIPLESKDILALHYELETA